MSSLDNIISISITRETQSVTQQGFGTFGIIAEFSTSKTTVTFDRSRTYASLSEMATDGWAVGDEVYDAAALVFSQNPKISNILVGRKDSGDASWSAALEEVQDSSTEWYTFIIIASQASTTTFDADFITSNSIDFTINETAVTTVPFNTDNATTYADIKTQIEADIANSTVSIDAVARTVIVEIFGEQVSTVSVTVTGGASQATGTTVYVNEDDYKAAAAWAETQTKIYFYADSSAAIYDGASTTDIAYFMQNQNYDRTVSIYHAAAQGDATPSWIESAWPGECLPYDVGEQTWSYKTLSGVAAYDLTSARRTAILGKNCNIYTTTAGVATTEEGKVASGEWIDIIRGVDALRASIQEEIFANNLVNPRKTPYTDDGINAIIGILLKVLNDYAADGFLIADSITVTYPEYADVSSIDKTNRVLSDIEFEASPQGAIHTMTIAGTISL